MLPLVSGEFRCVADPEIRFAPSGVAVGKVRAVASSRKKDESGEWVDDKTCWVTLTAFKKVAENMVDSFVKGDLVIVTGRVSTEDWEDKDGNKRTSVNLVVDSIGPSIAFTPAQTQRSETGSRRTEAAIQQSRQTVPADDEPPF